MKKLSQAEVAKEFSDYGCELLGIYEGCGKAVSYRCSCGKESEISLDKLRQRVLRGEGCVYCRGAWTEDEDHILRECYGREGRAVILQKLSGKTYSAVKSRAAALGLKGDRSRVMSGLSGVKKYKFDEDFFSIPRVVSSYWAGYLSGHGYRMDCKDSFYLRVSEGDRWHLEQIRDVICHTGEIKKVSSGRLMLVLHGASSWRLHLMKNYGVLKLDERNSQAYIAGLLDGGDCIDRGIVIYGEKKLLVWVKGWFDRWYPELNKKVKNLRCYEGDEWEYAVTGARSRFLLEKLSEIELPRRKKN